MTVTTVYTNQKYIEINNQDYPGLDKLITLGVLCNDTKVNRINGSFELIGDSTEKALMSLAIDVNVNPVKIINQYPRIHEFSFDSERKLMTTINEINGKYYAITKGAPDVLFNLVSNIDGNDTLDDYNQANINLANKALRVLAIAYKEINKDTDFTNLTRILKRSNIGLWDDRSSTP